MSNSWMNMTSFDLNSNPLKLKDDDEDSRPLLGLKLSVKDETGALMEELNRVNEENKKLTEMLTVVCENYNNLRNQVVEYMNKNSTENNNNNKDELTISFSSKKRKSESTSNDNNIVHNEQNITGHSVSSSTEEDDQESSKRPKQDQIIKAKVSHFYMKTTEASNSGLVVKDGYQWRKYGQKVTRDNPSPRAYFKCSYAPSCPVKKKVQRSVEDQSVVVATYEGEHNHPMPAQIEATQGGSSSSSRCNNIPRSISSAASVTLDLTKSKSDHNNISHEDFKPLKSTINSPEVRQFLVEQMASSLTKDPNFTAALAAAISGRKFSS